MSKTRSYDMLARRLLPVMREGGKRKYAILLSLVTSWGYTEAAFKQTIGRLKEQRQVRERRRQGGVHLEATR